MANAMLNDGIRQLNATGRIQADPTVRHPHTLVNTFDGSHWNQQDGRTPSAPRLGWRPPYEGDPPASTTPAIRIQRPMPMSQGQNAMEALSKIERVARTI